MDESVNVVLRNGIRNTFSPFYVNVLKIKVPNMISQLSSLHHSGSILGGVHATDQVVYHVGMSHALLKRLGVPEIIFLECPNQQESPKRLFPPLP